VTIIKVHLTLSRSRSAPTTVEENARIKRRKKEKKEKIEKLNVGL